MKPTKPECFLNLAGLFSPDISCQTPTNKPTGLLGECGTSLILTVLQRCPLDSATCSAPADFITRSWQELSCQWTAPWLWSPILPCTSNIFRCGIVYWNKMRIVWGICASLLCISSPWRMLWTDWLFIHLVSLDIWDISTQTLLRNCFLTWALGFKQSYLCFTTCSDYNDSISDTSFKKQNIRGSSVSMLKDLLLHMWEKCPHVL